MVSFETRTRSENPNQQRLNMKLEVAVLPVADVDRAKKFYSDLGWRLDADFTRADGSRAVQFTPPGSPASIQLAAAPLHFLVVSDIGAARDELIKRGADVSEVFHRGPNGRVMGPDPDRPSYGALATFGDSEGNAWLIQQLTQRLPGRVEADTTFASSNVLADALRRAAAAHDEHEKQTGQPDANWFDWYADYIVREQAGRRPA
ncbi:glyoxalase [Bradyrhizobium sp. CCBAU 051011]|uniref:VOC family protein n=1 Tax=Bradyrhizobium sp. CCBAU 051011 TaxID=858422 RepID=UPI001373FC1F|nr:VOC family protein [Bradyrhizobium sp. CCBAU 051011]QHO71391.1 glyoxalase [Bradyrhizobium sp. CCBAU 051011]